MKFRIQKREDEEIVFLCVDDDWRSEDFADLHRLFDSADNAEMFLKRSAFYRRGDHVFMIGPLPQ